MPESKTFSYEYTGDILGVSIVDYVKLIKVLGSKHPKQNVRICFHEKEATSLHRMLILEKPGHEYPPHVHRSRAETHLVFDGKLGIIRLDENGAVAGTCVNSSTNKLMSTLEPGEHHLTLPIGGPVIYLEIKNGKHLPFKAECFTPIIKNKTFKSITEYNSYIYTFF